MMMRVMMMTTTNIIYLDIHQVQLLDQVIELDYLIYFS